MNNNHPWFNDKLQFARLIAECMAQGVFTIDVVNKLTRAMDLDPGSIFELVDRAQELWDKNKSYTKRNKES